MKKFLYAIITLITISLGAGGEIIKYDCGLISNQTDTVTFQFKNFDIDTSNLYIRKIKNILDTLAVNKYYRVFIWKIYTQDDIVLTSIQGHAFCFVEDPRHNISGILNYNYKGVVKPFIIYTDSTPTAEIFCREMFKESSDSTAFVFLPKIDIFKEREPNTFYAPYHPPLTRVDCLLEDSTFTMLQFIYNNQTIEKSKTRRFDYKFK